MIHFHSNIFVGLYLKGYICTKKEHIRYDKYNNMEIIILFGCLYTGYRIFRKKGEHFFDI